MKKLCLFCLLLTACCLACFTAGAENRLTLMVYMTGSDLESLGGAASADLEEMSAALRDDGVTVAVLTGGASGWQNGIPADRNILWRITRDGMERMEEEKARSMGDPAVLNGFIRRSMELFPADRYALVLWDHGAGPLTGVCFDERFGSDGLTLEELREALGASPCARTPLMFIGFDACLMGTAEVADTVAPYAEYMIASQEPEPAAGWDYSFLSALGAAEDGLEAGKRIVDAFAASQKDTLSYVSLSCLKLSETDALERELDALFGSLAEEVTTETYPMLASGRVNTRELGASSPMAWDLVDLKDLAEELEEEAGADTAALQEALDRTVAYAWSNEDFVNGLSIYAPFGNKEKYSQRWALGYEKLGFSRGYRQYVKAFADRWLENRRTFWRDADLLDEAIENQRERITMKLSPEEAADVASARLLILEKIGKGNEFRLLNTVEGLRPEDGVLSAVYHQEALFLTNENGTMTEGPLVWLPLEGAMAARGMAAARGSLVTRCTLKPPQGKIVTVYLTWIPDEEGIYHLGPTYQYNELLGIYTLSGRTLQPGDIMTTGGYTRALPEQDAFFQDWKDGNTMVFYQETYTGETEWQMRFLPLESEEERYAVFEITDLQANPHLSEPVLLENSSILSMLDDPAGEKGNGIEVRLCSADVFTGFGPYMDLKFEVTNHRGRPVNVQADGLVLNQTALSKVSKTWGEKGFGMFYELQPGQTETLSYHLYERDLLNAGQRRIESVRLCIGTCRSNGNRTEKHWFDFDLQADLGIILPASVPEKEKPLLETRQDGVTVTVEGFSKQFSGDIGADIRVTNDTDRDLWVRGIWFSINGSDWVGSQQEVLVPAHCGTWTFSQILTGFRNTGELGKVELYSPVSDPSEVRTVSVSVDLQPAEPILVEGTVEVGKAGQ